MAFCHQCGTSLETGDRFCPNCGTPVRGAQPVTLEPAGPGPEPGHAADSLNYQGVGIRFVAQLIDGIVLIVFYLVIGYLVAGLAGGLTPEGFKLEGAPAILVIGLTIICWLVYFIVLESFWRGRTLGKRLTGIQVVKADGAPIGFSEAVVRNVLRLVDGFCCYLVGAILVWLSPRRQRLGDRVAKTVVVKARK